MKPSTVLKKARKLIERGWCRDTFARTAEDEPIFHPEGGFSFNEKNAAKFCLLGAVYRAAGVQPRDVGTGVPHVAKQCTDYLHSVIKDPDIIFFNNRQRTRWPVLCAFDRAIKLAESEGR